MGDVFGGNVLIQGTLTASGFVAPSGCITPSNIATPAAGGNGIDISKLNHRNKAPYSQPEGTAVVTETRIIAITHGTVGVIVALNAALKVACVGAATITIDLKKNGTSVLSSVLTFTSSTPAMTAESGTITTTATAIGDIFELVITATAGGGTLGQGLYAEAIIDETPN